jgi:hypothetical protein
MARKLKKLFATHLLNTKKQLPPYLPTEPPPKMPWFAWVLVLVVILLTVLMHFSK